MENNKSTTSLKYGEWVVKRKWLALTIGILLTLIFIGGLGGLSQNPDNRIFFSKDNPQLLALEALERTYTRNDNVFILLDPQKGDIFTPETLDAVRYLTDRLWKTPSSSRVDSITNFQWTRADGDNVTISDLVKDGPITEEVSNNARNVALAEPLILNLLVDPDAKVTGINVNIIHPDDAIEAGGVTQEVIKFIRSEIELFRAKYPDIDIYLSGGVPLTMAFTEVSLSDLGLLMPIMLLVIFLVAGIALSSVLCAVLTALIVILSVIGMFGVSGYMHFILNAATFNSFLMLAALTIAHCVHVMSTQRIMMRRGKTKSEAVTESIRVNLQPVFITAITTAIGFMSMHFSDAPPFRELGYMMVIGNVIVFIHAVVTLPALLAILPARVKAKGSSLVEEKMEELSNYVIKNKSKIFFGSGLVMIFLVLGMTQIRLDDTWTLYFDERFEIRTHTDFVEDNLTGMNSIEYSIPAEGENGINDPEYLYNLDKFASWYKKQSGVNHVTVISDTVKRLNKAMHSDDQAYYRIPESRDLAAQFLLLYELSVPFGLDLNNRINVAKSATRMTVSLTHVSNDDIRELEAEAQIWLAENIPAFKTTGSGLSVIFSHFSKRNIDSMLGGTAIALVLISFILIIALQSFRVGIVSLIPNLFPAAMGFGLWGYLFHEVGVAISVVAAMTTAN